MNALRSRGLKVAVASSSAAPDIMKMLTEGGLKAMVDFAFSGEDCAAHKPAPDIYLKACELLGESPEDCIALEDSRNGLWSAHNAGCRVIMVPDLWQADAETEKILWKKLGSLLEVRNFLRGDE